MGEDFGIDGDSLERVTVSRETISEVFREFDLALDL